MGASGDLPGVGNPEGYTTPVLVLRDGDDGGDDEGRAMLEIVHDIAPAGNPLAGGQDQQFAFEVTQWGQPISVTSPYLTGNETPAVFVNAAGRSAAVWVADPLNAPSGVFRDVDLSLFDENGTKIAGPIIVDTPYELKGLDAAMAPDGSVIVVCGDRWSCYGTAITAYRFAPDGVLLGQSSVCMWGSNGSEEVAILSNGDFVVAWTHGGSSGLPATVNVRVFNQDGTPEGDATVLTGAGGAWAWTVQRAYLTVDLAGQPNVILRYWQKELGVDGDDVMPDTFAGAREGDGTAISADGVTWYRLESLTGDDSAAGYQQHIVNLDAEVSRRRLAYGDRFYILFQHQGSSQGSDGKFAFDDISLASEEGDFWGARVVDCTPSGTVSGPVMWNIDDVRLAGTPANSGAAVVDRNVFYNGSSLDGGDPAANQADDNAIDAGKCPLLPGQAAGPANITAFSRGINGIMIDLGGLPLPAIIGGRDFAFRAGSAGDPATWGAVAAPGSVTVRRGEGKDGSDRVTLVWPDGAIAGCWLQVTVLANDNTGLATDDVFYYGNLSGDATGDGTVDFLDYLALKQGFGSGGVGLGDLQALQAGFGQSLDMAFWPPGPVRSLRRALLPRRRYVGGSQAQRPPAGGPSRAGAWPGSAEPVRQCPASPQRQWPVGADDRCARRSPAAASAGCRPEPVSPPRWR